MASTSISLSWQPSSGAVAGYAIRYGLSGGDLTHFALSSRKAQADVLDLQSGSTYSFRVQAFDTQGKFGPESVTLDVQTLGPSQPDVGFDGITTLDAPALSPGALFEITGSNLTTVPAPTSEPFPTELNQTQVLFNGIPVGLASVAPNTIRGFVPWNVVGDEVVIRVINQGRSSISRREQLRDSAPLISTWPGGAAYALHGDTFSAVSQLDPALPGEDIILIVSGLGTVEPLLKSSERPAPGNVPRLTPSLKFDDQTLSGTRTEVLDAENGSYFLFYLTVPAWAPAGQVDLVVESGTTASPSAFLWMGQ